MDFEKRMIRAIKNAPKGSEILADERYGVVITYPKKKVMK